MDLCIIRILSRLPNRGVLLALLSITCVAPAKGQEPTKAPSSNLQPEDPYLWLEDVTGERALAWVKEQNAVSTRELQSSPDFEPIRPRLLAIMDSKEKIPYVSKHGPYYYNFWRDEKNVRGLWRRT